MSSDVCVRGHLVSPQSKSSVDTPDSFAHIFQSGFSIGKAKSPHPATFLKLALIKVRLTFWKKKIALLRSSHFSEISFSKGQADILEKILALVNDWLLFLEII